MKSDKINMKIIAFLWIAIFLSTMVTSPASSQESPKADHLALGSYNIRNARGMDERLDYDRIAQVISRMRIDAIALQELDSATHRSEGLYVLGELAKRTGLRATFAPAIEFDGGKYGIGILSQETPISVQRIPLPGEEEKRVLLVTEFERYVLACVHFSLTEKRSPRVDSTHIGRPGWLRETSLPSWRLERHAPLPFPPRDREAIHSP